VPDRNVKGTVWEHLSDEAVDFDTSMFEAEFAAKVAAKRVGQAAGSSSSSKDKKPKPEVVELVDAKRSYNVNIALARFRMSNAALRDAIFAMDSTVLNEDKCVTLLNCLPTPDEVEAVKAYSGPMEALGKTEQFFAQVGEVPRVLLRTQLLMFKNQYFRQAQELAENLGCVERSLAALSSSRSLKKVLEVTLALGNYMNGGTRKGQAYGFKINSLNKMCNTKTANNKETMLHFLVKVMQAKFAAYKNLGSDLEDLPAAVRVQSSMLNDETAKMNSQLTKLGVELAKHENDDQARDAFKRSMTSFYNSARAEADSFVQRVKDLTTQTKELAILFGEDPKTKFEELVDLFNTFRSNYLRTEEDVEKKKAIEAKEAERQSRKNEQERANSEKKDPVSLKNVDRKHVAVVDKVLNNLQKANATSLSDILRERRKLRKPTQSSINKGPGESATGRSRGFTLIPPGKE